MAGGDDATERGKGADDGLPVSAKQPHADTVADPRAAARARRHANSSGDGSAAAEQLTLTPHPRAAAGRQQRAKSSSDGSVAGHGDV
eukprot:354682-Chlamydomonas_euryale.AAC.6